MKGIVLTDDELKILERRLGPGVRKMGPWNSDGTFGYSCISMADVGKAAESIEDPNLRMALARLDGASEQTAAFIALLETSGRALIERIVAAYRQSLEQTSGTRFSKKPAEEERRSAVAATG